MSRFVKTGAFALLLAGLSPAAVAPASAQTIKIIPGPSPFPGPVVPNTCTQPRPMSGPDAGCT